MIGSGSSSSCNCLKGDDLNCKREQVNAQYRRDLLNQNKKVKLKVIVKVKLKIKKNSLEQKNENK